MLTVIIFILGALTVMLSLMVARVFIDHAKDSGDSSSISRAISWQLWGESVIGAGTLVFATAAHFGWLPSWTIEAQSTLRGVMFLATSLTTLHLYLVVRRLKGK